MDENVCQFFFLKLVLMKRMILIQIHALNTCCFFSVCEHACLCLRPQGDGQTWNNHTVTPGHTNCQCAARNVVSNAAHATHNGSSLSRRTDTNPEELFSFTSSMHFRGTLSPVGIRRAERSESTERREEKSSTFCELPYCGVF